MSDVRKSVPAKVIASLLILVSVFSLCWQGMAVLRGIDYVLTDSWQDTWEFKELIREREDQLAEWFAARAALEDPGLAYLDQVRYETDAERIGVAMAQDQTSFRYRVLSQDGTKVLAAYLAPGESLEQLVAESLGKDGQGILPNIEVDSLLLKKDPGDRSAIVYLTRNDLWDERRNFEMSLSYIDPAIPRANYKIDSVEELAEHFVMWEYAIAMCGYLMKICPFDQPDVASAKAVVLDILKEGQPEPDFVQDFIDEVHMGEVEVRLSPCFKDCTDVRSALRALLGSIQPGDFFALNAFLPFTGEGRREALETIRHGVAEKRGVVSCLEVGPRYLHSTGQLHKGGPNCGVFLILSADELKDIPLKQEAESLGSLAKAQASGDLVTLAERGRRVVHLHLPDNSGVTLRQLAEVISDILETMTVPTA